MRSSPSRAYSLWVLALLSLAYVLNFIDRQVLAVVSLEVKAELGLSDTQLGILMGPAFALCFTLSGFVLARLADTGSRKWVLTLSLAAWSLFTAGCGVARSFAQLALFRFAVGIGEAGGAPPSQSMISDYFPPERRARALSVFSLGIYLGTLFGFAGGGLLAAGFDWRTAFLVAGALGLPLTLLIAATVREPAREAHAAAPAPTGLGGLRGLFAVPTYRWLMAAAACQAFVGFAVLSWSVTLLRRVHALEASEAGVSFGLIAGVTGGAGSLLGGTLADRLARHDARWYAWLSAAVSAAAFPFMVGFTQAGSARAALVCIALFYFLNNVYVPSLWTLVQSLVHPRLRALSSATQLAVTNVFGYAAGAWLVGALNDALAPRFGDEAIRWSLLVTAIVGALSAPLFLRCARDLRADLASAAAPNAALA
jgi:predicted MFS family arabinose efflux permease